MNLELDMYPGVSNWILFLGIMLVYDITNSKSFDNIAKWLRNIQEHANEDVEKMILGNKCDMEDKRVIPKERGKLIFPPFSKLVQIQNNQPEKNQSK